MVEERHLIPLIHRTAQATQDSQLPRVPWGHAWPSGGLLWGSTHHFLKDAPAAHSLSLLEHWGWSLQFWLALSLLALIQSLNPSTRSWELRFTREHQDTFTRQWLKSVQKAL